jgi:hypothetical protein
MTGLALQGRGPGGRRPHTRSDTAGGASVGYNDRLVGCRPGNPQFPFPRFPIWPGIGEGIPDSRFGRNRESGNPPIPDLAGNRESGSRFAGPGISWSGGVVDVVESTEGRAGLILLAQCRPVCSGC